MSAIDSSPGAGALLRQLLFAFDGDVQAVYDELGVAFRPRFFPIVQQLELASKLTVSQLAERIGVSQPAMTQTLNEMRREGLVSLQTGPDRRAREVCLAGKGKSLCEELRPTWDAIHKAAKRLDAELPVPLREVVEAALASLARQPFCDRIKEELE